MFGFSSGQVQGVRMELSGNVFSPKIYVRGDLAVAIKRAIYYCHARGRIGSSGCVNK